MVASAASAAERIGRDAGLVLDPWQRIGLDALCGLRADALWAASEAALVTQRRNGKFGPLVDRLLGGMYSFGDMEIRYTTHRGTAAKEAARKLWEWIQASPELLELAGGPAAYRAGHDDVSITIQSTGALITFTTRAAGGSRGADGDVVVFDEALYLTADFLADVLPVILARPNPQVIYLSNAGMSSSEVLHDLRRRALEGVEESLAYCEWGAERPRLEDGRVVSDPVDIDARENMRRGNPALGYRLTEAKLLIVKRGMRLKPDLYARECLGVFDPLPGDTDGRPVKLPPDKWEATAIDRDEALEVWPAESLRSVAFDVDKDGRSASTSVAAGSLAGACYVENTRFEKGVGWLPSAVVELMLARPEVVFGCNNAGATSAQVGAVLEAMAENGIRADRLRLLGSGEFKAACGGFLTAVEGGRLFRPGTEQDHLDKAAGDAAERPLSGGFAWAQRNVTIPISPLNSVSVARALLPVEAVVEQVQDPVFVFT